MSGDIYCDGGHLCVICWAKERREAIGRWLFLRLPVRYRHRILMRAAMRRRREWQECQKEHPLLAALVSPRSEHLQRRLWCSLMGQLHVDSPTYRVEWVDDDKWKEEDPE